MTEYWFFLEMIIYVYIYIYIYIYAHTHTHTHTHSGSKDVQYFGNVGHNLVAPVAFLLKL